MATTEQLMAQYGVAWFGFDESSGNVYDKLGLGSYIGTVTGATRTQGWNGQDYAMSFNSTSTNMQRIQFNQKIIPMGEKTIRMKYKISALPSASNRYLLLSNNSYDATKYGIEFTIHPDGTFRVWVRNQTTVIVEAIASQSAIPDNKWHDVFFAWDGTVNPRGIKLYVDDMTTPKAFSQARALETIPPSDNLVLGNVSTLNSAQNNVFFVGQMDDIQIYNKALTPIDFEQRRLIHNVDNKGIIILDNKVKQLPNTSESTMLQQGRVVNEIDFAVDKQPLDLTVSVNKYEVASNTQSPSGMNKIFTILTEKGFKTIEIEDNY